MQPGCYHYILVTRLFRRGKNLKNIWYWGEKLMAYKLKQSGDYRKRRNFSMIKNSLELDDLLAIQKESYNWFATEGVGEVLKDFSPVEFLNLLSNSDTLVDSYNEYLEGTSKESKFVSMVSKLESDMQAKVYEKEGLLTEENALEDIKNHPDDISIKTVNKPSDDWLNYNRKFYDELFTSLSLDIEEL